MHWTCWIDKLSSVHWAPTAELVFIACLLTMVLYWFLGGENAVGKCHMPVWHICTDTLHYADATDRCFLTKQILFPYLLYRQHVSSGSLTCLYIENEWYMLALLWEGYQYAWDASWTICEIYRWAYVRYRVFYHFKNTVCMHYKKL